MTLMEFMVMMVPVSSLILAIYASISAYKSYDKYYKIVNRMRELNKSLYRINKSIEAPRVIPRITDPYVLGRKISSLLPIRSDDLLDAIEKNPHIKVRYDLSYQYISSNVYKEISLEMCGKNISIEFHVNMDSNASFRHTGVVESIVLYDVNDKKNKKI